MPATFELMSTAMQPSSVLWRCRLDLLALLCCLQLLVHFAQPVSGQGANCAVQLNSCQCQTQSGKYIDLAPLARIDDYRFKKVPRPLSGWVYSYNPCIGFKCEEADGVASCQNDKDDQPKNELALGTQDTAQFGFALGTGLSIKYTSSHTTTKRVSLVKLICAQAQTDVFEPNDDGERSPDGTYYTYSSTLTSKYACEVDTLSNWPGNGGGGMSAGDVLLIVLFVGIFAYLAFGFAVNVLLLKKALGWEAVPNVSFWVALPGYVRDGGTFCVDKVRQLFTMRKGTYDSI